MAYQRLTFGNSASPVGLVVLRCNDPLCEGADESITWPDTSSSSGDFPDLRLDAAGNPVVAHTGTLFTTMQRVLHCGDPVCTPDFDGDRCPDANEDQTRDWSEWTGGQRDRKNPDDYFNPSGDGLNRVDDILLIVQAYFDDDDDGNPGLPPYEPGYNPDTDRSNLAASPNAWNTGAPDGVQRVQDIVHSVNSYFHDCV